MLDLDIASSIQTSWEESPKQELIRKRIDKDGILIGEPEPDLNDANHAIEKLRQALLNGEQCHIKGKV